MSQPGYTRIRGALANLGHQAGRSTVRRLLLENGLEPAPRRTTWATFLRSHWEELAATDMFTVEVLMPRGLVRYAGARLSPSHLPPSRRLNECRAVLEDRQCSRG